MTPAQRDVVIVVAAVGVTLYAVKQIKKKKAEREYQKRVAKSREELLNKLKALHNQMVKIDTDEKFWSIVSQIKD